MNPPPVETVFAMPDPGESPLNLQQLFTLANRLVSSTIDGPYVPTIVQSGVPDPDLDQDKIWVQLDSQGRPIAIKIYWHGHWRRVYNGMVGEIRGFTGAPGFGPAPALFNTTGRGNAELEYDGWHICNGKDGVIDLSDKFVVGAHMNNDDSKCNPYDHGWQTYVDGKNPKKTGGEHEQMIAQNNLPSLDNSIVDPSPPYQQQAAGLWINGEESKMEPTEEHSDARIIVDSHYAALRHHGIKLLTYGADPPGNPSTPPNPQVALPILPPFYALAWITFVGYS